MMRAQQAIKYTGQRTNFFSLLRFDFMLDEDLDTYLIEVRGSVWRAGLWLSSVHSRLMLRRKTASSVVNMGGRQQQAIHCGCFETAKTDSSRLQQTSNCHWHNAPGLQVTADTLSW